MWHSPYCTKHIHLDKVDSTNSELLKRAADNATEMTIITADCQVAGRGQRGRKWVSPSLKGLYYSILFRPNGPPEKISLMTLMAGIAVYDTIELVCSIQPDLKWPNDVLIMGRKVAGILTESTWEGATPSAVVIGVGINLSFNNADFPTDIIYPATSLFIETGQKVSRESLFVHLTERFHYWNQRLWSEDHHAIVREWMSRSSIIGKNIKLSSPKGMYYGVVRNISSQGHIELRLKDGTIVQINSGTILSISSQTDC